MRVGFPLESVLFLPLPTTTTRSAPAIANQNMIDIRSHSDLLQVYHLFLTVFPAYKFSGLFNYGSSHIQREAPVSHPDWPRHIDQHVFNVFHPLYSRIVPVAFTTASQKQFTLPCKYLSDFCRAVHWLSIAGPSPVVLRGCVVSLAYQMPP